MKCTADTAASSASIAAAAGCCGYNIDCAG